MHLRLRNQTSQLRRDLFEHDSLEIAKQLSDPLALAEDDHKLLFMYIKRLTKYQCSQAIDYLIDSAVKNCYFSRMDLLKLKAHRIIGFFRYKIVFVGKKILLLLKS